MDPLGSGLGFMGCSALGSSSRGVSEPTLSLANMEPGKCPLWRVEGLGFTVLLKGPVIRTSMIVGGRVSHFSGGRSALRV